VIELSYLLLKYIHVLGGIVILGTGTGIAFFMLMAHRSGDIAFIARTAGVVVLADFVFTATAVIAQPITGFLLLSHAGHGLADFWVMLSIGLYILTGFLWLPVVWMQRCMRVLAEQAVETGTPLPDRYYRLFKLWFVFGIPGFGSVLAIVWLMIAKPMV
jgi:uncharacterized membrane protein